MISLLRDKLLEVLKAVAPLILAVCLLQFTLVHAPLELFARGRAIGITREHPQFLAGPTVRGDQRADPKDDGEHVESNGRAHLNQTVYPSVTVMKTRYRLAIRTDRIHRPL